MDSDFASYIERLELIAFFSGYPLIYAIIHVVTAEKRKKEISFANRLIKLLPFAYALSGTLFLGLILKDMSPYYSLKSLFSQFQTSYLKIWGIMAVLFWIPALSKKPVLSLIHSLLFFFLILKDLFLYINSSLDKEMLQNDMKLYTTSLLITILSLFLIVLLDFILKYTRNKKVLPR